MLDDLSGNAAFSGVEVTGRGGTRERVRRSLARKMLDHQRTARYLQRTMRGARTAWAIALVVGCARSPSTDPAQEPSFGGGNFGPAVTAGEGFASGSRLSAGVLQAEGGATLFDKTWRDTKLDVPCAFAVAADMTVRCLPGRSDLTLFTDEACQSPVYARRESACDPPFQPPAPLQPPAFFRETVQCSAAAVVRTVGQRIETTSGVALYTRDSTGACVAYQSVGPIEVYAAGDAVDPKTFVAQTSLTREPRGASYAVERMTAEDGASAIVRIIDVARNESCAPLAAAFGAPDPLRCYPPSAEAFATDGIPSRSSDAACTVPVAEGSRCWTPSMVLEVDVNSNACGDRFTVTGFAAVGAEVTSVYGSAPSQAGGASCLAESADIRLAYFAVGAPVDVASFPSLARAEDGTARVRVRTLTAPSGDRLLASTFYDADHDTECEPQNAADGIVRCLPARRRGILAYADPQCTIPIVGVPAGCATKPRFVTSPLVAAGCSASKQSVFAVGAPAATSVAYLRSASDCGPWSAGNYVSYDAVEIPASEFSAMRRSNGTAIDDTSLR
ncbi:MAG: hypothetical protein JWO86_647 [Myxococcaceae bacterium]|nr:hypothetical protein [Myxococcaceae bacterium]